jgi:ATP-binding cassette subfamily B protein
MAGRRLRRRRRSIAAAFSCTSLVILDEPAARIDPATEALVRRALAQLLSGRTGLVIAHRRTTLNLVDSIALLERGTIVERIARDDPDAGADSRVRAFLAQGDMA